MHFWSFCAKYWHFLPILSHARPKTNANKVPRWVLRYVGKKTFDFSSKRIFLPKTTKFSPKLAFLSICLIWCPVGGLAGGFGAGCISQDTYILYSNYDSASVGVSAGVIGTIEGCESSYAHGPRRHPLSVRQCLSLHKDSQSLL